MKKISIFSIIIFLISSLLIYENFKTATKFSLMPQEESDIWANPIQLQELSFYERRWSFDYPKVKLKDCNPFRDYWSIDDEANIILSMSNDAFRPTVYDNLYKKVNYTFPALTSENISKLTFANIHPNDQLLETDNGMIYWNTCEIVAPEFTEEETLILSKLILENKGNNLTINDVDFILNPKTERPYVWYIRLYCKDYDNIYYNCNYDVYLCRDINNNYYLQHFNQLQFTYTAIPDMINNKIKNSFDNVLFEYDNF